MKPANKRLSTIITITSIFSFIFSIVSVPRDLYNLPGTMMMMDVSGVL